MDLTQEDLAKMSPEEIRILQKKNCVFCHIAKGDVASKKIFEDNEIIGILDINPANPGHLLLMPKEHFLVLPQLSDPEISHLFMAAKGLSHVILKTLKAQGTDIFIANGALAGQKSPHFMMHVIPRMENDGLTSFEMHRQKAESLDKLKKRISPKLYSLLGGESPEIIPEAEVPKIETVNQVKKIVSRPEPVKEKIEAVETNKEVEPKKEFKPRKAVRKEPQKNSKEDVNLDDIARLLG